MSRQVRTRFAPSPTGFLHIGGARTALFAWLYARHHKGKFLLRIEDTDAERSSVKMSQQIIDALQWLGLAYDDEVVYQSDRKARYSEAVEQLLDEKKAYRCYCTKEELEAMRQHQIENKQKPRYDGRCRDLTKPRAGVTPVIRFRNPLDGPVTFVDHIHGTTQVNNSELDDLIIVRSDGQPTYNFCVVVDDMDMEITHIIRGDDHISNTPRQINLWHAFNATPPEYAHVPMILNEEGKRLSKRAGSTSVSSYEEQGYLPESLLNYLVRLGWAHGDQEVFTLSQMIELFDLKDVSRSAASLDTDKLNWLNARYISALPINELSRRFVAYINEQGWDIASGPQPQTIVPQLSKRHKTIKAMALGAKFLYSDDIDWSEEECSEYLASTNKEMFYTLLEHLKELSNWRYQELKDTINRVLDEHGAKLGKLGKPLRFILTAGAPSPDLATTLEWIGRTRSLYRIECAMQRFG